MALVFLLVIMVKKEKRYAFLLFNHTIYKQASLILGKNKSTFSLCEKKQIKKVADTEEIAQIAVKKKEHIMIIYFF